MIFRDNRGFASLLERNRDGHSSGVNTSHG